MRTKLNSLRIILSIKNTININSILHGIRNIPFIGKFIPEKIYGIRAFKIIALIISLHVEIFKAFFGKLGMFMLLSFASVPISTGVGRTAATAFLYGFVIMSLFLVFFNGVFAITAQTKYSVFYLGMDAKEYVESVLIYKIFNILVGYVCFGIPAALIVQVKWYIAILIPLFGVGLLMGRVGILMLIYSVKQSLGRKVNRKGVPISVEGNLIIVSIMETIIFFGGIVGAIPVIYYDLHLIAEIAVIIGALMIVPGFLLIKRFPYGLYRTALFAENERLETIKNTHEKEKKKVSEIEIGELRESKKSDTKRSKGFKYLNELFVKRHSKVFFGRLIWTIVGMMVVITLASVFLRYELKNSDAVTESTLRYVFSVHPGVFVFILCMINRTAHMARAMYANCDSSLLMYGFYKTPEALAKMYRIRCVSAIKYNMIPGGVMAVFAIVVLMVTGGEEYTFQYIFTVLEILFAVVFFSVRHMALYYLLQPYNSDFMVKSFLYNFLSLIIGTVCFALIFFPFSAKVYTVTGIIFTLIYVILSNVLVRKFGQRTFRIK
ncbi:MAG: hypothetical protein K5669_05600 [Lachnospiraceae bacterium]|nr:hypothetical protein [Lachnospiraceae bacterium]